MNIEEEKENLEELISLLERNPPNLIDVIKEKNKGVLSNSQINEIEMFIREDPTNIKRLIPILKEQKNNIYGSKDTQNKTANRKESPNVNISEYQTNKKQTSRSKTVILTILLFLIIVILFFIAGFFGKHFLNIFLFSLIFGFPLLILYKNQIIKTLPSNVANWIVDEVEDVGESVQENIGNIATPLYVKEYQLLSFGILSIIMAIYLLYKKRSELSGIFGSIFFTILASILIIETF